MLGRAINSGLRSRFFSNPGASKRALCNSIQRVHPHIGKIYHKLLDQRDSGNSAEIPCNFVTQVLDYWASTMPNQLAIRYINPNKGKNSIEEISYQELVARSHQIANHFRQQGLKKGDSVALALEQEPAWWYSLAGLVRGGFPVVPCSHQLTKKDLQYRINGLGIRGIVATPDVKRRVEAVRYNCPTLASLVATGYADSDQSSIGYILKHSPTVSCREDTTMEDTVAHLYTSGTTGLPKAVRHCHDYLFFHWPTGRRWLQATPDDLIYNTSDPGWGFMLWTTAAAWAMGASLLVTPTRDPQEILSTLRDQPITILCAAPTVLRKLVAEKNFNEFSFPTLKKIAVVGEPLDETVAKAFENLGIEVRECYGQAELPPVIGRIDNQPYMPNSMGTTIDPYKVVIVDESFQPLPIGNVGQIALDIVNGSRGGTIREYVNDPERTASIFSPDGSKLLTGDYGYIEEREGGVRVVVYGGRRDDLIKAFERRIGPFEIEEVGMSHKKVAKVAAIGVPISPGSQNCQIKIFILLKPGYTVDEALTEDIKQHFEQEIAEYKRPHQIEFLSPKEWEQYETTSGKIRRAALREREEQISTSCAPKFR
jgi:medium-chain acyl-CoA synthetase